MIQTNYNLSRNFTLKQVKTNLKNYAIKYAVDEKL